MFIVNRKENNKPNMHFRMHESGLHYYNPDEYFTFINTLADNKRYYSKRQIKAAERASDIYGTFTYTSVADYIWDIQSNQINDCPVIVQEIYVAITIWGKECCALKGHTTRKKIIPVTEDLIQAPKELIKLHRDIIMTVDILFMNKTPLFLILSRNICFTTVHHIADRKDTTIYTAFNEVYIYYRNRGFRVITLHTYEAFALLQTMITDHMPGVPSMNLTSNNEHVPEIEHIMRVVKERARCVRQSPLSTGSQYSSSSTSYLSM